MVDFQNKQTLIFKIIFIRIKTQNVRFLYKLEYFYVNSQEPHLFRVQLEK